MSFQVKITPDERIGMLPLGRCYPWWQNFMDHILRTCGNSGLPIGTHRDNLFDEYHVKMINERYVDFDSEERYNWFLLRWT